MSNQGVRLGIFNQRVEMLTDYAMDRLARTASVQISANLMAQELHIDQHVAMALVNRAIDRLPTIVRH